jgi:hypothetical protein
MLPSGTATGTEEGVALVFPRIIRRTASVRPMPAIVDAGTT